MKKLFFITFLHFSYFAQSQIVTLSFVFNKQNNVCLNAKINASDSLLLMFHSSSTDVTITKESLKERILLKDKHNTNIQTWGGRADAEFSEHNTLFINKLKWGDITIFVNENSGSDTDGKFGYDLFAKKNRGFGLLQKIDDSSRNFT